MSSLEKYRQYAEKVRLFHELTPEEVDYVLHQGKVLHFHAGMSIFHEGTLGNALFVVFKGEVGITLHNQQIATCGVGDVFGEMAVLNHSPRTASAAALSDAKVFALDEKELNEILQRPVATKLLINIIHVISERLELANVQNFALRKQLSAAAS